MLYDDNPDNTLDLFNGYLAMGQQLQVSGKCQEPSNGNSSSTNILVTVPHAACPKSWSPRHCDRTAEEVALLLAEELPKKGLRGVVHIYKGRQRSQIDMNRKSSRSSEWREMVRRDMQESPAFHLDIHSFSRTPKHRKKFPNYSPVYALHVDGPASEHATEMMAAIANIPENPFPVYSGAPGMNALQEEAIQMGIPSVLLEFDESIRGEDLRPYVERLVRYLATKM